MITFFWLIVSISGIKHQICNLHVSDHAKYCVNIYETSVNATSMKSPDASTLFELYPNSGIILDFLDHLSVAADDHTNRVSWYRDLIGKTDGSRCLFHFLRIWIWFKIPDPILILFSQTQTYIHASSHSRAVVISFSITPMVSLPQNLLHHFLGFLKGKTQ